MFEPTLVKNTADRAAKYYTQDFHREDYYVLGDEPLGTWSESMEKLGLTGYITKEDMALVMRGQHPQTGQVLVKGGGKNRNKRLGYDCPFSAPKDYSLVWAKAKFVDPELALYLEKIHEDAIDKVLNSYIMSRHNSALTRRVIRNDSGDKINKFEPIKELLYSKFQHRTSREIDPQLHTHVFIYNMVERLNYDKDSERFGAIEMREIYENKYTIGAVYRAELARSLQDDLGIKVVNNGHSFRIDGISDELINVFSKRSQQIQKETADRGIVSSSRDVNNRIALVTRASKKSVESGILFKTWGTMLDRCGFTDKEFSKIFSKGLDLSYSVEGEYSMVLESALEQILLKESTFTRQELEFHVAKLCQGKFGLEQIKEVFARVWKDTRLIGVGSDDKGRSRYSTLEVLMSEIRVLYLAKKLENSEKATTVFGSFSKRLTGSIISAFRSETSLMDAINGVGYESLASQIIDSKSLRSIIESSLKSNGVTSAKDRLSVYRCIRDLSYKPDRFSKSQSDSILKVIRQVGRPESLFDFKFSKEKFGKTLSMKKIEKVIKAFEKKKTQEKNQKFRLLEEQRSAIDEVFFGGNLVVIEGRAGTGKTTVMEVIKKGYEKQNRRVLGLTPSHRAKEELESKGIKSRVFASAIEAHKRGKEVFRDGDVVICDEMGMVGTEDFRLVMEALSTKDVKVILVGDSLQIAPVAAGSPFRLLLNSTEEKIVLKGVIRQKDPIQREAAIKIREGRSIEGLSMLYKNGNIRVSNTREESLAEMTEAFLKARLNGLSAKMIVNTNEQASDLNARARELLVKNSLVAKRGKEFEIQVRNSDPERKMFAKGDEVILRKNDYRLGLYNGTRGVIQKISGSSLYIKRASDDKVVEVPAKKYRGFDHAYASTTHSMQGATTDVSLLLGSLGQDLGMAYVGASRQVKDLTIYAPYEDTAKVYFHGFERQISMDERQEVKDRAVVEALGLSSGSEREKYNVLDVDRAVQKGDYWKYDGPDRIGTRALQEIQSLKASMSQVELKKAFRRVYITAQGVLDKFQVPKEELGLWQLKAKEALGRGVFIKDDIEALKVVAIESEKGVDSIHNDFITSKLLSRRDEVREGFGKRLSFVDQYVKNLASDLGAARSFGEKVNLIGKIYVSESAVENAKDLPILGPWHSKAYNMLEMGDFSKASIDFLRKLIQDARLGLRSDFSGSAPGQKRSEVLKEILGRGFLFIDPETKKLGQGLGSVDSKELLNRVSRIYSNDRGVLDEVAKPDSTLAPWQNQAYEMLSNGDYSKEFVEKLEILVTKAQVGERSVHFGANEAFRKRQDELGRILRDMGRGLELSDA